MSNVWTLVGLVGAVAVLLILVFVIESSIHAKIQEFKERKIKKRLYKTMIDELDKQIKEMGKDEIGE